MPELDVFGGTWNWSGKVFAFTGCLLLVPLVAATDRRRWLVFVIPFAAGGGLPFSGETIAFQLTMPTLDEELFYRGILLSLLFHATGSRTSPIWITGILFGLAHVEVTSFDVLTFLRTCGYGLIGGWLTVRSDGSLLPVAFVHSAINTLPFLANMLRGCLGRAAVTIAVLVQSRAMQALSPGEEALVELGRRLRDAGYQFTTVTPETHRRVRARSDAPGRTLRDVFGWSRPFDAAALPPDILDALERSGMCVERGGLLASRVRFSTLGTGLYVHSAYPTTDENAVFFGPDTYRYCAVLAREVTPAARLVDVGCGSGVGGLSLADRVERIVLADINERALGMARVNAHLAGVAERVEVVHGDLFAPVAGAIDLVIANPPYLLDPAGRVYRDGGGDLGTGLGVRIVREAVTRLSAGGALVLYTGAPVVDGTDVLRVAIAPILDAAAAAWTYEELDPDVFGEELDNPGYATVERIAAVAAVARLR